ncbi:hypothetical protein [Euzebya tangerina]|uniref:hypothetical protein n=1 Tax=Euzebya tangerina TaxID=591198 RepID=UPI000E3118EA|nr:hypothetical protein [Euzebya tangerina]
MTGTVTVDADPGSFAQMIGGLIDANLRADPAKARVLTRTTGRVALDITDRMEAVELHVDGIGITVSHAGRQTEAAELRIVGTADAIMGLSTVPLRFGLPDLLSSSGRRVTGRWASGGLEIHGLPQGTALLRVVLGVISVVA